MYFNGKKIDGFTKGGITATDVDAIIEPDAPITKEIEDDQLKLGLDIDTETMEITQDGKLAVKSGGGGGATKYQHNIQLRFSVNPTWQDSSSQVVDTTALITFIDDNNTKITSSNIISRVFNKMGISNSNRYYLNTRDKFIYDSQTGNILEKIIYCSSAFTLTVVQTSIIYINVEPFKLWKYDVANDTYTRGHSGLASSLIATIVDVADLVVEI